MRKTSVFFRPLAPLALCAVLLTGCNATAKWDQEYTCTGQEQSNTAFSGDDPAHAIEKTYPMTIDFHRRSDKVFVKTYVANLESDTAKSLHFAGKNPTAWLSGQFEPATGQLALVEGRRLNIAGRTQLIRTSGQYICHSQA